MNGCFTANSNRIAECSRARHLALGFGAHVGTAKLCPRPLLNRTPLLEKAFVRLEGA
jgi:hypothetical protein